MYGWLVGCWLALHLYTEWVAVVSAWQILCRWFVLETYDVAVLGTPPPSRRLTVFIVYLFRAEEWNKYAPAPMAPPMPPEGWNKGNVHERVRKQVRFFLSARTGGCVCVCVCV